MSSLLNETTGECISGTCQALNVSKELFSWFLILGLVLGIIGLTISIISHKKGKEKKFEDLKKILRLWIEGEEMKYPLDKDVGQHVGDLRGRGMLFEEIKKIFDEK